MGFLATNNAHPLIGFRHCKYIIVGLYCDLKHFFLDLPPSTAFYRSYNLVNHWANAEGAGVQAHISFTLLPLQNYQK